MITIKVLGVCLVGMGAVSILIALIQYNRSRRENCRREMYIKRKVDKDLRENICLIKNKIYMKYREYL